MKIEPKIPNIMKLIQGRALEGDFVVLPHALARRAERGISIADIVHVLVGGSRETNRDRYRMEFCSWNYAVRGDTVDRRNLRIAVAFDRGQMIVVTVIRLSRERR